MFLIIAYGVFIPNTWRRCATITGVMALAPVLIGTGTGASTRTLDEQLLERASRPDYHAWLAGTAG